MKCPSCNSEIKNTAKRCPVCDAVVSVSQEKNATLNPCATSSLLPSANDLEKAIRQRIFGSEEDRAVPAPSEDGDEVAMPPLHTYGAKLFQDKKDNCVVIQTPIGAGTGFFLKNGIIATNAHVIAGSAGRPASTIIVNHRGTSYKGRVIRADFDEDIAIVDLPYGGPSNVEQYENEIGDPHELLPGDQVFSVGNSRGWGLTYNQFVIKDITKKQDFLSFREVILMNGTCQPGNSGGPLYNVAGQVVGIMSFSPVTTQKISIYMPQNSVLNTYMAAAEAGVCGGVTINTLMSLM